MTGFYRDRLLFAIISVLTLMATFHVVGPNERRWEVLEFFGWAAVAGLAPSAIPNIRVRYILPTTLLAAAFAQALQYFPVIPGAPSVADLTASIMGVCCIAVAFCFARFVTFVEVLVQDD